MSKEEDFFKENFPEYVTEKGEFLSPYWDLFRAGVICAIFESKVKIEQLEKENAELDCQRNRNKYCYSCANATERCFRNEIACPCQKYKSYTEENTELKEKLEQIEKDLTDYQFNYPSIKKLSKENAELKEKLDNLSSVAEIRLANWQKYEKAYKETEELLDKQIEATYKVVEENNKLKEKAKDIVTALLNVFVYDLAEEELDVGHTDFRAKAEQFLREIEK